MKKLLILLLLVTISTLICPAQRFNHRSLLADRKIRSGTSGFYVPDSIIVYSNQDTILELPQYSTKGLLTTDLIKLKSGDTWIPYFFSQYSYDDQGYLNLIVDQEWINGEWVNGYRYSMELDAQGHLLSDLDEEWSGNEWIKMYRGQYAYDQNGNMVSQTGQLWSSDAWVNSHKTVFTHDAHGNVLTETDQWWSNDAWNNLTRLTRTWDSHNNNLNNIAEIWSVDHWEVNGRWRHSYTYNAQGKILTILTEHELGSWENDARVTYTYDNLGQETVYLSEEWVDFAWQNHYRFTHAYDPFGNPTLQEFFVWDSDSAKWGHSETEPFIYEVTGQEQWTFFSGIKMTAHWVQQGAAGMPDVPQPEIGLAPNPAGSILRVTGDEQVVRAEVYTCNGTKLETNLMVGRNMLDVSRLPAGLYLLKVTTPKGSTIKRFVKN
jgi:hypothetical protein